MRKISQKDTWGIVFFMRTGNFKILSVLFVSALMLVILGASLANANQRLSNEVTISNLDNEEHLPSVAYNSKHREYFVVWHTEWTIGTRDIRAARVSEAGQIVDTFTVYEHATKDSGQPSVDYDPVNDRYLVTWIFDSFGNGSDWDLYGRFIPWNGPSASLNEFSICSFATHQWNPKVAYGRTVEEFLVVWANEYQTASSPMYISGRRIKASDGSFFGSGSDITISHLTEPRVNPDVTYNLARNEYLVVYDNATDIFGMRLTGTLSGNFGGEFAIAGWPAIEIHPAVAACKGADQYLVVWQSDQDTGNDAIYARFISGGGTPGNVYLIDDTTSPEREADVTCNLSGGEYFIAWQTRYTNLCYGVWGCVVHPNETLESQFGIVPPGATANRTNPAVAGSQRSYIAAWEHQRDGTSYQDIHGRLVFQEPGFLPAVYHILLD